VAKRETEIFLSCDKQECNEHPKGQLIRIKPSGYVPGEIKCVVCGEPLTSDGEKQLANQIFLLGIETLGL
jgi:hypothetical protein